MVIKHSHLPTYIQELKQLIADDLCQAQFFQQINQDLDEITHALVSEKLAVHLLSADRDLANSFYSLLNPSQNLEQKYQFRLQELPSQLLQEQKSVHSAFLVLKEPVEGAEMSQIRYTLSSERILIGRKPECDIYIPDHYTCVSGWHLEVRSCSTDDRDSSPQWQVKNCDGCRNGTYINGEPLVGNRILKPGDCLILGDQLLSSKSPQLIFECPSISDISLTETEKSQNLRRLVNCDILFLIVDSDRQLSKAEEKLLESASVRSELRLFLVFLAQESAEITCINQQENSSISLKNLSQQLASMSEHQDSLFKVQRILNQTTSIIAELNQALTSEEEALKQEIEKMELSNCKEVKELGENKPLILKTINEQKMSLLKMIEASVNQSKQDLLDDSLSDSIIQKIQDFIDSLEAHVFKQGGKKYLELRTKEPELNVNDFMVQSCENELLQWADEEWRKMCKEYGNGGLEGLVRSANILLKTGCGSNNRNFSFKIKHKLDLERIFQAALRRIPGRIEYQEDPVLIYFVKKIRGSVFQVMGILFLFSFLGLSRTIIIKAINREISNSIFLSIFVFGVFAWLAYKLYKGYQKDRSLEIYKAAEKIRQDLKSYYFKVVKNRFIEKIAQSLEAQLKEEASRFDENIKSFLDITNKNASEINSNQADSRNYLRSCQDKTKRIDRKLRDLQKIKDKFQRLQLSR